MFNICLHLDHTPAHLLLMQAKHFRDLCVSLGQKSAGTATSVCFVNPASASNSAATLFPGRRMGLKCPNPLA